MTQEELDAIKARCEAATAGPWHWSGDYPSDAPCPHGTDWTDHGPDLTSSTDPVITSSGYDASSLDVSDADAEFIAAARSDVPALLAEIERLEALLDEAGRRWGFVWVRPMTPDREGV